MAFSGFGFCNFVAFYCCFNYTTACCYCVFAIIKFIIIIVSLGNSSINSEAAFSALFPLFRTLTLLLKSILTCVVVRPVPFKFKS